MPALRTNIFAVFLVTIALCCSIAEGNNIPTDELPMYGGKARTAEEKKNDAVFIQQVITETGSKEAALKKVIGTGFEYFRKNDFKSAMKAFNQAWLMAPDNADILWGFGNVLGAQGSIDQAIEMLNKAVALSPRHVRAMVDLAFAYQLKAYSLRDTPEQFSFYLDVADRTFAKADKIDPGYEICYVNWARNLFLQGRFQEAWEKVAIARKLGGKYIDKNFLQELSRYMPEPK